MAKMPHVLTDLCVYLKGDSFAGQLNKMTLPDIVMKTVEKAMSGTAGSVERSLGRLEKLESEVSIEAFDQRLFALVGNNSARDEIVTVKGALDVDGSWVNITVNFGGLWKSLNLGEINPEKEIELKSNVALEHFEVIVDGVEFVFINKMTNVVRMGGVDITAQIRACIGQ